MPSAGLVGAAAAAGAAVCSAGCDEQPARPITAPTTHRVLTVVRIIISSCRSDALTGPMYNISSPLLRRLLGSRRHGGELRVLVDCRRHRFLGRRHAAGFADRLDCVVLVGRVVA